jgi:GNAT acetyltransferase-like protein
VTAVSSPVRLTALTFARQGQPMPYDIALVRTLDQACREHAGRRILLAEDLDGRAHAALYLVWDQATAYNLIAGADAELRSSGAQSLLAWEAIRFAATVTRSFDFEGSMLEPVERFVRGFGARQVPYFSVSKTNSVLLEARSALRGMGTVAKRRIASRSPTRRN